MIMQTSPLWTWFFGLLLPSSSRLLDVQTGDVLDPPNVFAFILVVNPLCLTSSVSDPQCHPSIQQSRHRSLHQAINPSCGFTYLRSLLPPIHPPILWVNMSANLTSTFRFSPLLKPSYPNLNQSTVFSSIVDPVRHTLQGEIQCSGRRPLHWIEPCLAAQ